MTTSRSPAPHPRPSRRRRPRRRRAPRSPRLSVGIDLVDVERFRRLLALREPELVRRVFTPDEVESARGDVRRLAARFAAKEAVAKTLGTGVGPVAWHDVEVRVAAGGRPGLRLSGGARALARRSRLSRWAVSLAHDDARAVAVVVATARRWAA